MARPARSVDTETSDDVPVDAEGQAIDLGELGSGTYEIPGQGLFGDGKRLTGDDVNRVGDDPVAEQAPPPSEPDANPVVVDEVKTPDGKSGDFAPADVTPEA